MIARLSSHLSWMLLPSIVAGALYVTSAPDDGHTEAAHARECHSCVFSRQQNGVLVAESLVDAQAP